ncbi:conjugal transfer protein TraF [Thiopseudomonas alkaliphila]|uniref:conjugal transfer protein TraF n=1 Tax=Thiopseudomonas alkaliphila TaxID=1697053 RepID=UPI002578E906|nr:conjugal transfer protein TraF [Thiopseudomonas alkaliphila]MDM1717437.1 conjugal transfer protein TraF [Thiopseudomonas alkaliphila]
MKLKNIVSAVLLATSTIAGAASYADDSRFYNRKSEGWFWYNEEPELEPEPEIPPQKPEVAEAPAPAPKKEKKKKPEVEPFSAEWVRVMLPKYQDKAWSEPTIENVRAYYYLQRFAIDRSEQFALAAQLAVMGDPLLDEAARRPLSSFAVHELDRKKDDESRLMVREIANRAGIFFFFGPNCDGCEIQAPIIRDLAAQDGFHVLPIAVGDAKLHSVQFENIRQDEGHADQLGVMTYPATYLATPDGGFSVVGQGAFALSEIRQRIILAAKAADIITDDEFGKTRPILNHNTNIAENLPEELLEKLSKKHKGAATDELIPASEIVNFFRESKGLKK